MLSVCALFVSRLIWWGHRLRANVNVECLAGAPPLLTREIVADVGILAEQLVMYDMPAGGAWEMDPPPVGSREVAAPFFPDRIAELAEAPGRASCQVRTQRSEWSGDLRLRREARVVEWVDTGTGTEKAACVMLWRKGLGGGPSIVVAFRGSKSANDWTRTNAGFASPWRRAIDLGEDVYSSRGWPTEALDSCLEAEASPDAPWAPLGVWRAYAGAEGRTSDAPRGRILLAVAALLRDHPTAELIVTGHSLGGILAQLCAYDLLHALPAVRRPGRPIVLLPFAAPPAFPPGFQRRMRAMILEGRLRGVHVTAAGDFAPKLGSRADRGNPIGWVVAAARGHVTHGITQRLVLNPRDVKRPLYYVAHGVDDDCADLAQLPFDQFGHNMYAKDLSAMQTPQRPYTVPWNAPWPLPADV